VATILVGVDSGDSSTRAVEYAVTAGKGTDTELVIAHVIHWSPFTFNTPSDNEERPRKRAEEIEHARTAVVAPMVALAEESGQKVTSEIRHGQPARTLIALAEETGAQQIVVGRTGDSGFHEAVFGSVVGRLAQTSPVPVTVVP
jgi:nucleotide-binding universal stress UspA family protein